MKIWNLCFKGILAYSNTDKIQIIHYTLGKYQTIVYIYGDYKARIIKYTNIPEALQDFRSRLYNLSTKYGRVIEYTKYGEECIKNWYKITNG